MEASPGPSRVVTPEPADNPFATPSQSTLNLALSQQSAIMTASGSRSPFEDGEQSPETPKAETANAHHPSASLPKPTPPQPLNLPEPRSPPPRTETPHASRPPEPIAPPTLTPTQQAEEPPEVRWWTEWCCGCSEGPDRGGDHQVSITTTADSVRADTVRRLAGGPNKPFRVRRMGRSLTHRSLDTLRLQSPFTAMLCTDPEPYCSLLSRTHPLPCDNIVLCNYLYLRTLATLAPIGCHNSRMPAYPLCVVRIRIPPSWMLPFCIAHREDDYSYFRPPRVVGYVERLHGTVGEAW